MSEGSIYPQHEFMSWNSHRLDPLHDRCTRQLLSLHFTHIYIGIVLISAGVQYLRMFSAPSCSTSSSR